MTWLISHLLTLLLVTPLAGVAVLLLVDSRRAEAIRWVAAICAGAGFLLSLPLWFRYLPLGPAWQFTERGLRLPSIGASYYVGVDGYSALLVLMTSLLAVSVMMASWTAVSTRVKPYYICLLVMQAAMLGVFVALDALLLSVCWIVVLTTMTLLLTGWGGGRRLPSARRFVVHTALGSAAILAGILTIYASAHQATGVYSFDVTTWQQLALPLGRQKWIFLALFAGFAVHAATFPLHSWLPSAQSQSPAAGAVLAAAVLLKMGAYGLVRFALPILPEASRFFIPMAAALSIATIVYGALLALSQTDWRRLIAFASVSQMGLILLGLFVVTPAALSGSLLHQISHGLSTGALYLMVGFAYQRRSDRGIGASGGLAAAMPVFALIFMVLLLSSVGLPGLSGFIGISLMVKGVFAVHRVWAVAAASGMVLSAAALLWRYRRSMFGRIEQSGSVVLQDLGGRELAALLPLVAAAAWIGLHPAPFLARLEPTMARVITRLDPGYAPAFSAVPGCGTSSAPAPSAPAGFTAVAPCDDPSGTAKPAGAK